MPGVPRAVGRRRGLEHLRAVPAPHLPALRAACNFLQCPLLERVTAQIARVTIPALAGYDVAMPETIALTVPREAVLSDRVIPGRNSFRVRATPGKATLAGSLVDATRMAAAGEACPARNMMSLTDAPDLASTVPWKWRRS